MYYGVLLTSEREPRYVKLVKLPSLGAAKRWAARQATGYASPHAADPALPIAYQNFHRWRVEVYAMPPGWSFRLREVKRYLDACGWRTPGAAARYYAVRRWGREVALP